MLELYAFAWLVRYGVFTPVGESTFDSKRAKRTLAKAALNGSIRMQSADVLTYE
jgi:hypothetical protein